jgi:hypothetical protein
MATSDAHDALAVWWRGSCKDFSLYFLSKSIEEKRSLLLKCSPDLPELPAGAREMLGEEISASDVLLQELSLDGLLSSDGKGLILMIVRRLATPDRAMAKDLELLKAMHQRGQMPSFSNGALDSFKMPFVDPLDPEKSIQCVSQNCNPQKILEIHHKIIEGELVDAEVWLSCTMRRNCFAEFISGLRAAFEADYQSAAVENKK